jgi:surfeit locus 1 family protein
MRAHRVSYFRRPAWWALLLTAAGVVLFIRLGNWQLDRADFKEELLRRYAASAVAPLQDFGAVADSPPPDGFPRVYTTGHYLADRLYLLDNPNHDERGGVEVFAPFARSGTRTLLLVDMGFLAGDGTGKTPALPIMPTGETRIQGIYAPPPPIGFEMGGNALVQQHRWPKTGIFLDTAKVADDLGHPLYPRILALDPDPTSIYMRVHTLDFSSMPPARHRAYAYQWYTFALAAVVLLLVLHRKRRVRKS